MFASLFIISVEVGDGGSDDVITLLFKQLILLLWQHNSPANNKVCEEGTSVNDSQSSVNFQWTAGNNTNSYDLRITNLNSNQVINQTNITSTNKAVTLSKGTPYSWNVTSKRNGTSKTAESSTWKFYLSGNGINNYPPYPSTLISPSSGNVFPSSTTSVELSWGSHPENYPLLMTYILIQLMDYKSLFLQTKISQLNLSLYKLVQGKVTIGELKQLILKQ